MHQLGSVDLFAYRAPLPKDYQPCDGRLLRVADWHALFGLLGTTFGGDGRETFGLPNLPAPVPGTTYGIRARGSLIVNAGDSALIGTIFPFAPEYTPPGTAPCNGGQLLIAQHAVLFAIIEGTFGGDRQTTFGLPAMPPLPGGARFYIVVEGAFPDRVQS